MEVEPQADPPQFEVYKNQCLENGKKMYLNANGDVRFLFGDKDNITEIPAHKAILATDSDVFERMFYGEMKEPGDIHVPDSTAAAFKEFLQYFYLSEVKLTAENLVDILYLGAKYNIKKCVNDCIQSLICALDDGNVLDQLNLALMYDQKEWIKVCEKRVEERTDLLFDSMEFLKCDKMALAYILKMEVLACTEIEVFKACMSWVKAKCDGADLSIELVERHLGKSFYDIRLASLTMDELCSLHTQYESVLTRDFIHVTNIIKLPEFQDAKFKKHPRHAKWDEGAIIKCQRVINDDDERRAHREYHEDRRYDVYLYYASEDSDGSYERRLKRWDKYDLRSDCPCGFHDESFPFDEEKYDRQIDTTEETTFSVSDPLYLGSLSCNGLWVWQECGCKLKAEMEIVEATDLTGVNRNSLIKMNIKFKPNDETQFELPHPVLIRPGFFYTIRQGPFPKGTSYFCKDLRAKVKHESEIKIEFHKNYQHSLIEMLNFNKI